MTRISGDMVRHHLPTHVFGQNVISIEQTGSTNTELKNLARMGAPEGLLYVTDEQLAGRGRLERGWYAPPGSSLLMSLLFRPGPRLAPAQAQRLTMLSALALVGAIEKHAGLAPQIKWPNDLVWTDGKKLAGILTELETEGENLAWVVVGLGVNINVNFQSGRGAGIPYPGPTGNGGATLAETATSLSMILNRDTGDLRLPILQSFLVNVERRYDALQRGYRPHEEWRDRLAGLGQPVTVLSADGSRRQEGIMEGVDENGALLLRQPDGQVVAILAGDVTLPRT